MTASPTGRGPGGAVRLLRPGRAGPPRPRGHHRVVPGIRSDVTPGSLGGAPCLGLTVPAAPPDREPGWLVPAAMSPSDGLGHRVQVLYAGERHHGNRAGAVFRIVPEAPGASRAKQARAPDAMRQQPPRQPGASC